MNYLSILKEQCEGNFGAGMWAQLSREDKFRTNNRLRRYCLRRVTDYTDYGHIYYVDYNDKLIQTLIERGELTHKKVRCMALASIEWVLANTDKNRWGWLLSE